MWLRRTALANEHQPDSDDQRQWAGSSDAGQRWCHGAQQNTVYWQTVSAATGYTLYWTDNGSTPTTGSDNITISGNTSTSYVHGGLDSTKTYNYKMVANIGSSVDGHALPTRSLVSPSAFGRAHNPQGPWRIMTPI